MPAPSILDLPLERVSDRYEILRQRLARRAPRHPDGRAIAWSTSSMEDDPVHEKGFAVFSPEELAYLADQRLARLATVDSAGQPAVDAVGFAFDRDRFVVGGRDLPATRKYRNVAAGNTKVSLIVDDLRSVDPWRPRGIRVLGTARAVPPTATTDSRRGCP